MKHRVAGGHFNRNTKQRKALFKGMVRSLLETGSITTTKSKAKETQRITDILIAKAKLSDLNSRRSLHRFFGKRDVVNTLVDSIAPLYSDVNSGFTTLKVIGNRRGDNAEMAMLTLLKFPNQTGFKKVVEDETKSPASAIDKGKAIKKASLVKTAKDTPKTDVDKKTKSDKISQLHSKESTKEAVKEVKKVSN